MAPVGATHSFEKGLVLELNVEATAFTACLLLYGNGHMLGGLKVIGCNLYHFLSLAEYSGVL